MYVKVNGMTQAHIKDILKDSLLQVTDINVEIGNSKGSKDVAFTIKRISPKYQRVNPQNGHKSVGVCYHAYLDYLRVVYRLAENAVIDSGFYLKLRYENASDFEVKKRVIGNAKIGSEARNKAYYLCCTCNRDVEGNPL